jgi:hypothetical protein
MAMWAEELLLRAQENRLEFSAPQLRFLTGRPLQRLQNAAPVTFDFLAILYTGNRMTVHTRAPARFVISYDLFEEKYAVTKVTPPRRSTSHLTATEAEAWCLQQMSIDVTSVSPSQPLWARVEIRAEEERGGKLFGGKVSEDGINITDLVEILSGRPRAGQPHWELEAGPATLDQLRRAK